MQLATEVQRTGTEYVAALSAFAAIVDSISIDVRDQGRDVAFAALVGATEQWAVLTERSIDADLLRTINRESNEPSTVRF